MKPGLIPKPFSTPLAEAARTFINRAYSTAHMVAVPPEAEKDIVMNARRKALDECIMLNSDLDRWKPADLYRSMFGLAAALFELASTAPGLFTTGELFRFAIDAQEILVTEKTGQFRGEPERT